MTSSGAVPHDKRAAGVPRKVGRRLRGAPAARTTSDRGLVPGGGEELRIVLGQQDEGDTVETRGRSPSVICPFVERTGPHVPEATGGGHVHLRDGCADRAFLQSCVHLSKNSRK